MGKEKRVLEGYYEEGRSEKFDTMNGCMIVIYASPKTLSKNMKKATVIIEEVTNGTQENNPNI